LKSSGTSSTVDGGPGWYETPRAFGVIAAVLLIGRPHEAGGNPDHALDRGMDFPLAGMLA
jgi:hypothetical protein